MSRVALIETKPSRNNFKELFEGKVEFDQYYLCSDPYKKKVLKRDVDIEIDTDEYDWVILVGSDALKFFTSQTAVTTYTGKLVDEKYLITINPAMLAFKPEARPSWERSRDSIVKYISGEKQDFLDFDRIAIGIQDTASALKFVQAAIDHPKPYIALDSETTGLYPRDGYVQGFSLCYDGEVGAYVESECIDEDVEELLQELFHKKTTLMHNAKFDLAFFEYHFNFEFPRFHDTMVLHYLIDETPGTHGLKTLAMHFTPFGDYEKPLYDWMTAYKKEHGVKAADFDWGCIPFEEMYTYAAIDAIVTFLLFEKFEKILGNKKLASCYNNILIPATRFLTDIQEIGVPFDTPRLKMGQALMQTEIDSAVEELYKNPIVAEFEAIQGKPFNPNSVLQLRKLLFDYIGLTPTKKTPKGAPSTDAEVLTGLAEFSEVPALILTIRQKSKIKNTYLDKIIPQLDKDNRLRTNFNLIFTTSGRLSSSGKLNMQQLPRDNPIVKGCIKARPGYKIVDMDLGTAEVYAAAVLSDDQNLMDVFRQGGNFHSQIAKKVFNLSCPAEKIEFKEAAKRQAAKSVTFGIMYGAGARNISEQVTKETGKYFSIGQAQKVIDDYFGAFPKLGEWIDRNENFIKQNGFIYSIFGRKRRLPNVMSEDRGISGHAVRSGLNFMVQSVASDINLLGAIDTHTRTRAEGLDSSIFALVHDSILAEVKDEDVDRYCEIMLECVQMDRGVSIPGTPIKCDVDIGLDYAFGKFEKMYGEAV